MCGGWPTERKKVVLVGGGLSKIVVGGILDPQTGGRRVGPQNR